jgi:hypothetical protein
VTQPPRPQVPVFTDPGGLKPAIREPASAVALSIITVHAGNSLSGLAGFWCHNPADWSGIAGANRSLVKNPDMIYPNEKLVLDCRTDSTVRLPVVHAVVSDAPSPRYHRHASVNVASDVYHSAGTYSFAGLESLWVSAGGPGWAESAAAAVAECESGGRADAYNPSGATGLWQILGAVVGGNLDNPYTNALNAVSKFRASGDTWAQWVCKP